MKLKRKAILVVDDDEGMRDTLSAILRGDYDIRLAATGEEGLSVLKRADINLMLLDVRMPGMSGLECTRMIQQLHPEVRVIILTGYDFPQYRRAAIKAGAQGFISKPTAQTVICQLIRADVPQPIA